MPKPSAAAAILRRPAVLHLTGLSYSTIYRAMRNGTFPARIRLGQNAVGWREADVLDWINAREPIPTGPVTGRYA